MNKARSIGRVAAVAVGLVTLAGMATPSALATQDGGTATVIPKDLAHPNAHWTVVRLAPKSKSRTAGVPALRATPALPNNDDNNKQVANVNDWGQVCGTNNVDEVTAQGQTTLSLSSTKSVSATWSANVSVAAWVITAGVGFSVTDSTSFTESASYTVPAGKFGGIIAHPLYERYGFDVLYYYQPYGGGYADDPVGYCYETFSN